MEFPTAEKIQKIKDLANKLRILSIEMTNASKSGHPTSCASMAELTSVLFYHTMKYKVDSPRDPASDRFVLSKGHCAPILYAAWSLAGLFPESELMNLRKIDNDLEGHPTPRLSFIDVATGSLGQGLSIACGMAYTAKNFDKASYRVYCLMGDGESAEGSVMEAANFASYYNLDNLVGIIDINRLGQSAATSLQHELLTYQTRWQSYGWYAIIIEGNSVEHIIKAFNEAATIKGRPVMILAKTFKGAGIPGISNEENWHGKALGSAAQAKIEAIKNEMSSSFEGLNAVGLNEHAPVNDAPALDTAPVKLWKGPSYEEGVKVATRNAYGTALAKLGESCKRVISLDGDTSNSTFAITFKKAHPDRFVECFIAEQNLVGVGIGCATRDRTIAFVSGFACFLSRAYDQIRMGAISQTKLKLVGSHVGVSIGEDGPSQMALEDIAMFRAVNNCHVFYPSDGVSCERAVEMAANIPAMCYIRTSRPATVCLYSNDEKFELGKGKVVRETGNDQVLLIGAGITLHECVKAHDELKAEGINVRLFDPFCLKPIDAEGILLNAKACGGKVITVEDHYPEGGLGEAVCGVTAMSENVRVKRLAVTGLPRSGPPAELIEMFGIGCSHIVKAVKEFLS